MYGVLIILFISKITHAQPPLQWNALYATQSEVISSYNLQQYNSPTIKFDNDKNLIASSIIIADDQRDYVIVKYDQTGQLQWDFIYDGEAHLTDYARDFTIDQFNNIIVTGETYTEYIFDFDQSYGESELFVTKLSPSGELLWTFRRPGTGFSYNEGKSIAIDENNNIYIIGQSVTSNYERKLIIIKLDEDGNTLWQREMPDLHGFKCRVINGILQIVAGGNNFHNVIILKYNSIGELLQDITIPDILLVVIPVIDDLGNVYVKRGVGLYKVTKFSSEGGVLWEFEEPKLLPPNVHADELISIDFDEERNVYVTGRHYGANYGIDSLYKNGDMLTIKLSEQGEEIWRNKYEHDGGNTAEIGNHIVVLDNGYVLVTGYRFTGQPGDTDGILCTLDTLGNIVWLTSYDGGYNKRDVNIHSLIDGNFFYTMGWSQDNDSNVDLSIRKYGPDVGVNTHETADAENFMNLFPNPATSSFYLDFSDGQLLPFQIELYDITARRVLHKLESGSNHFLVPNHIIGGIYTVRVLRNGELFTSKICITHK